VALVPVQPFASVAVTVTPNEPVCVGVPEIVPVAGLSVRPAGSVPLASDQVMVPMPSVWVKVSLNGLLATPMLLDGFVTVMVWQAMVMV
jgi:hypothetical protein